MNINIGDLQKVDNEIAVAVRCLTKKSVAKILNTLTSSYYN